MSFKTRPLANFDSYQIGLFDAANAKQLLAAWVDAIPNRLFGYSPSTSDRRSLRNSLRMRYTCDFVEYQVVDQEIDELTLAALGDHLRAFAQGWAKGFQRSEELLMRTF